MELYAFVMPRFDQFRTGQRMKLASLDWFFLTVI
jgi:hypothetical protein